MGLDLSKDRRETIGVLISSIEESCQSKIWLGMQEYAANNNIELILYVSTFQQKAGKLQEHYSVIFDAVKLNDDIDGLIIFSGFIAEDIGSDEVAQFVQSYHNAPIVSIASVYDNITTIQSDNKYGIYNNVVHLIEKHNCEKIAFIRGPKGHSEAEERFAGFKEAMQKYGKIIDEDLIFPGHFSDWSGEEAVQDLLDNKKRKVDAIVCADDDTAIGAIKELSRRGLVVPRDVLVTGFDNNDYAEIITPSLTTAQQSFFEIGVKSLSTMVDIVHGVEVEECITIPTQNYYRQSCGCIEYSGTDGVVSFNKDKEIYEDLKFASLQLFPTTIPKNKTEFWIEQINKTLLFEAIVIEEFLHLFDIILIEFRKYSDDISVWNRYLELLLNKASDYYDSKKIFKIADAIIKANQLINRADERNYLYHNLKNSEEQWEIRGIAQDIVTSFNIDTLSNKLNHVSKNLNIDYIYIFLYEKSIEYKKWEQPTSVSFKIEVNTVGKFFSDKIGKVIPITELQIFKRKLLAESNLPIIYMPLFFGNKQTGIMIVSYNPDNPIDMYETLRLSISTSVRGALLLEQVEKQSTTDSLTGLYNRRGFVSFSLARLKHLRRSITPHSLFFIDMDGLKHINDTFGHKEGDKAITICAQLLRETFRESDIIGRMGGDEFTILTSQVDHENIDTITLRLRKAFDKFNQNSQLPYKVNCSIGAYNLFDFSEKSFNNALQKADELLYEEKKNKREQGIGR